MVHALTSEPRPRSSCFRQDPLTMNKLLLLTPLLMGAMTPLLQAGTRPETAQSPDQETRTLTLDITGMT